MSEDRKYVYFKRETVIIPLSAIGRSCKVKKKKKKQYYVYRFFILQITDNLDKNSFVIQDRGILFEIIHDASLKKKGKN